MFIIVEVPRKKDQFIQEQLYIEEYPCSLPKESKEQTEDEENRGVFIIELL